MAYAQPTQEAAVLGFVEIETDCFAEEYGQKADTCGSAQFSFPQKPLRASRSQRLLIQDKQGRQWWVLRSNLRLPKAALAAPPASTVGQSIRASTQGDWCQSPETPRARAEPGLAKDAAPSASSGRLSGWSALMFQSAISGRRGVFLCRDEVRRRSVRVAALVQPSAAASGSFGLANFADERSEWRAQRFRMPDTERRLQRIVDQIAEAWPYPEAPRPRVLIDASMQFNAEAFPDNTIVVSLGVLAPGMDGSPQISDAELYWLLAHEYSHIALDHFRGLSRPAPVVAGKSESDLVAKLSVIEAATLDPVRAEQVRSTMELNDTLIALKRETRFTSRRNFEDEADVAATDLVLRLGYTPNFSLIAETISESEAAWRSRLKRAQDIVDARTLSAAAAADSTALTDGRVDTAIRRVIGDRTGAWLNSSLFLGNYRSARTRADAVRLYVSQAYVGHEPKWRDDGQMSAIATSAEVKYAVQVTKAIEACQDALIAGDVARANFEINRALHTPFVSTGYVRFWAARAALADHDLPRAVAHLEIARRDSVVSPVVYRDLAKLLVLNDQPSRAASVIADGSRRFGDADYFLPEQVRLSVRTNNWSQINTLLNQCRSIVGSRSVITFDCYAALADFRWETLTPAETKLAQSYTRGRRILLEASAP